MSIYTLFILLNINIVSIYTIPIKSPSVYEQMMQLGKVEEFKCLFLRDTMLFKPEPPFLKMCSDFNKAGSLTKLDYYNMNDALCLLYYNNFGNLCSTTNIISNTILQPMFSDEMLQNITTKIEDVCRNINDKILTNIVPGIEVVISSLQDPKKCIKMCTDFDDKVLPVCSLSAYMAMVSAYFNANDNIATQTNASANKGSVTKPRETKHQDTSTANEKVGVKDTVKIMETKTGSMPDILNNPQHSAKGPANIEMESLTSVQKDNIVQDSAQHALAPHDSAPHNSSPHDSTNTDTKVDTMDAEGTYHYQKSSSEQPTAEQVPQENMPVDKLPETLANSYQKKTGDVKEPSQKSSTVSSKLTVAHSPIPNLNIKAVPTETKTKTPDQTENKIKTTVQIENKIKTTTQTESKNLDMSNKNSIMDNPVLDNEDKQSKEEFQDEDDDLQYENNLPQAVKNEIIEKTKPREIEEDVNNFSPGYANQSEEDDSYFFSYFMMFCIVFIAGYVGYHNKQKILALVLEGRKGKRNQRRRPNSANYHKLDSNLEEAVSSSVNKSTNNVIY